MSDERSTKFDSELETPSTSTAPAAEVPRRLTNRDVFEIVRARSGMPRITKRTLAFVCDLDERRSRR